jgi:hypothetical protein
MIKIISSTSKYVLDKILTVAGQIVAWHLALNNDSGILLRSGGVNIPMLIHINLPNTVSTKKQGQKADRLQNGP